MATSSDRRDVARLHRGRTSRPASIPVLVCLVFTVYVAFGEDRHRGVNRTACRDEPLVLTCAENEIVSTKLYGGHHENESSKTCCYEPRDCRAPIRGFRISHWTDCLWKMSNCTIQLPSKHVFLHKPCAEQNIHYLIAEDFKCVPKNDIYVLNGSEDTRVDSMSGYILSPDYPGTYTGDGRSTSVTLVACRGCGVFLRTVDMEVRPMVAGVCTDYVEVHCSADSTSSRHCGNAPLSVTADRCRGDVRVTFTTTRHTKLYKGFIIFFCHFLLSTTTNQGQDTDFLLSTATCLTPDTDRVRFSPTFLVVSVALGGLLGVAIVVIVWLLITNRRLMATRHATHAQLRTIASERNETVVTQLEPGRAATCNGNGVYSGRPNTPLHRGEYCLIRNTVTMQ